MSSTGPRRSEGLGRAAPIAWRSDAVIVFAAFFCMVLFCLALEGCDVPPEIAPRRSAARAIASEPAPNAAGVDRLAPMWVEYERPLAPASVSTATVRVASGMRATSIAVRADPALPGLRVDPLTSLDPDSAWALRIEGARDLDGVEVEPHVVRFSTGRAQTRPPRATPSWAEIGPLFARACGDCHRGDAPIVGLDLASAEGVRRTAVGAAAIQTGARPSPGAIGAGVLGALAGMARIEALGGAGQPEHSYLVYKLIGDDHVIGESMPPPRDAGAARLSRDEVVRIAEWIRGGAPTE